MDLAKLLRTRRKELDLSQREVAEAVGVSRTAVGLWETGQTGPKRANVQSLARILKIDASAINPLLAKGVKFVDDTPSGFTVPILEQSSIRGRDIIEAMQAAQTISVDQEPLEGSFAVILSDDSMAPVYHAGDTIVLYAKLDPKTGDDVLAQLPDDGPAIFRRYTERRADRNGAKVFDLFSTDPNHVTITGNSDNRINILGVAVEHRRKIRR